MIARRFAATLAFVVVLALSAQAGLGQSRVQRASAVGTSAGTPTAVKPASYDSLEEFRGKNRGGAIAQADYSPRRLGHSRFPVGRERYRLANRPAVVDPQPRLAAQPEELVSPGDAPLDAGMLGSSPMDSGETGPPMAEPDSVSDAIENEEYADGDAPEFMDEEGCYYCGAAQGTCCHQRPFCICIGPWFWENLSLFAGVHSFRNNIDQGLNSNFGYHEGFNWAVPVYDAWGVGGQIGGQVVHSDLSRAVVAGSDRRQYFVTAGLFHRAGACGGLQGGGVLDYLHDDYFVKMDIAQVRGELSWKTACGNDFGFLGAFNVNEDSAFSPLLRRQVTWRPIDQYSLFYRHCFCSGAVGRIYGGVTRDSRGLLGANFSAPLSNQWSFQGGFAYIFSEGGTNLVNSQNETWGLTMNLVWTPGHRNACSGCNPYRPLFNVADNTTFLTQQLPQ